jgi:uncharacterized LabA/DUF88 family protein
MDNVAVYWDFENIHASLCNVRFGEYWYKNNRFQNQSAIMDIDSVMEYVATLGNININKAYGNWGFLNSYNFLLQNHSIDLLQLFPRGAHGKNGADIRMAIDIIEDLSQNPHISIIVVLGGDSDYISVAQKVRQKGRRIVGIGVQGSTNQYWIRSCNEFKYYASLLVKASATQVTSIAEVETESLEEAKVLLCKAVAALSSQIGGESVLRAAIKPMMTRFDSSFDEANFGYKTFTDFLNACQDVISISQGKHDQLVEVRVSSDSFCNTNETQLQGRYVSILRRQQFELVQPSILEVGTSETFNIFADNGGKMHSYKAYKDELQKRFEAKGIPTPATNAWKVKNLLYKSYVFKGEWGNEEISLFNKIKSGEDLLLILRQSIVKQVVDNIQDQPDIHELSTLLYGNDSHIKETNALIEEYTKIEKIDSNGALTNSSGLQISAV